MAISHKELLSSFSFFDLHVHSHYSYDCKSNPKELIKQASKVGLRGLAITDHDNISFYKNVDLETKLLIIPGIEISSSDGHIIALGIHELITKKKSVEETVEKIKELGGEVIIPHPFDFLRKGVGKKFVKLKAFSPAVETVNGSCVIPLFNKKAQNIANQYSLPQTGGSDSHRVQDIGLAFTLFPKETETVDDALEFIRRRKTRGIGNILPLHQKIIRTFQIHF